eukprot:CAMPEP_0185849168 /NCGR_PEP_ID=MMETSP1354-20130828/3764_1 /TAXON_ID=708628 /ORGANISM="Erythrolobus madagascarensis, Strain CCMP3276" /LENGTH=521 /DNA_ID=CAMNT_0028549651 /DNA_START=28 /DNA_END=1593 /DNA_ORIENTATION=+
MKTTTTTMMEFAGDEGGEGGVRREWNAVDVSALSSSPRYFEVIVVGGGAAGFFGAIECARHGDVEVAVFEALPSVLTKVKISGGGRCNVTHAADFDDKELLSNSYPRGNHEMMSPFVRFGAHHTRDWFEKMGVSLKTESDGRVFPVSDSSQSIIDALTTAADRAGIRVICNSKVLRVQATKLSAIDHQQQQQQHHKQANFCVEVSQGNSSYQKSRQLFHCAAVLLAPGASRVAYEWASQLGHGIASPVPSLFTLRVVDKRLDGLAGVSVADVAVELTQLSADTASDSKTTSKQKNARQRRRNRGLKQRRELLITHWGFSGPAVLRLSAFGARQLHDSAYAAELLVNWRPCSTEQQTVAELLQAKERLGAKQIGTFCPLSVPSSAHDADNADAGLFPRRLWRSLLLHTFESDGNSTDAINARWRDVKDSVLRELAREIHRSVFRVAGKGAFKEEFVTCGGVRLSDVDFRTMESKRVPHMFLAGEQLDVDAVTGGFNLQAAWTTGYIAGASIREQILQDRADA